MLERKLGKGVGAIHYHLNPPGPAHLDDLLHWENLTGSIRDMADMNHLGARCDRFFNPARQIIHARRRHLKRYLLEHDAVPALALLPRGDHAAVVLIGGDHLVATL